MAPNNEHSSFCIFIGMSWNEGAISQQFQQIANELANRGNRVVVLIDHHKKRVESQSTNPILLTWPSFRPTKLKDVIFLRQLIKKYRPNALLGQFSSQNLLMTMGLIHNIPCRISWLHSINEFASTSKSTKGLNKILLIWRRKAILRMATHVVGVSNAACLNAHQVYGVPFKKMTTMYNCLRDPLENMVTDGKLDRFRITCASRLIQAKGQETLVRALVNVREQFPSIVAEFIGSGEAANEYKQLARSLNVEENCLFHGELDHKSTLKRLQSAWISIFPTKAEALGFVAIESLAVGTPLITSNIGGLPEIITDGEEGFLIPPNNPHILSERICALLSNEDLRKQMGEKARLNYLNNFNDKCVINAHTDKIEEFVRETINI